MADEPAQDGRAASLRQLWAADGLALVAASVATLVVELGVFITGLAAGLSLQYSTMAFLGASCVWVALSSGPMAAGGSGWISATLRGGIIADASGLALIAAWLTGLVRSPQAPMLTFLEIVEIYCTFAVLSLAAVAAVQCARGPAGRYAMAVASAVVMMAALATPFWTGGIREHARPDNRYQIVMAAAEFNPFYAVSLPVARRTDKPWSLYDVMYKDIRFAQNQAVGTIHWYDSVVRYGLIAIALAAIAVVRGRLGKKG